MKVLMVGFHLAERLSQENQDVVVIDTDPERAQHAAEQLDVMTVVGNGASLSTLEQAGIKGARMLLAVTSIDEVNLISCLAAKRLNVDFTVARVSNPDYVDGQSALSGDQLGIDLMINPVRESAWEAFHLLQTPAATDTAYFANGKVQLMGLRVLEGSLIAGKTLAQLGQQFEGHKYVTAAIVRDGVTRIPDGKSTIEADDHIYLLSTPEEMARVPRLAGYEEYTLRRVMIAGGSAEGEYLGHIVEQHGVECTILDRDRQRCVELAEALPKALVLHGDATDLELLEMEGVAGVDGFVSATHHDETNILTSLLAKNTGAKRVVAFIQKFEYLHLVPRVDVDAAVSPRMSTVNAILRYVRGGRVMSVATLKGNEGEIIDFSIAAGCRAAGKRLNELNFPDDAMVGSIIRGGEVIAPLANEEIREGDDVIVFSLPNAIADVEKIFG
jgi:trk system potassium uptake protein TrkA